MPFYRRKRFIRRGRKMRPKRRTFRRRFIRKSRFGKSGYSRRLAPSLKNPQGGLPKMLYCTVKMTRDTYYSGALSYAVYTWAINNCNDYYLTHDDRQPPDFEKLCNEDLYHDFRVVGTYNEFSLINQAACPMYVVWYINEVVGPCAANLADYMAQRNSRYLVIPGLMGASASGNTKRFKFYTKISKNMFVTKLATYDRDALERICVALTLDIQLLKEETEREKTGLAS